jgi:hypothetical protein
MPLPVKVAERRGGSARNVRGGWKAAQTPGIIKKRKFEKEERVKPMKPENDRVKFLRNRGLVDLDKLEKYSGLWVLWSPDGSEVLGSGETPLDARENAIREQNVPVPAGCVLEYIPECDTIIAILSEG